MIVPGSSKLQLFPFGNLNGIENFAFIFLKLNLIGLACHVTTPEQSGAKEMAYIDWLGLGHLLMTLGSEQSNSTQSTYTAHDGGLVLQGTFKFCH